MLTLSVGNKSEAFHVTVVVLEFKEKYTEENGRKKQNFPKIQTVHSICNLVFTSSDDMCGSKENVSYVS